MKKKSVVIETMERMLSPYGFHYSGYEGLRWTFSRDMNGNIQYVVIQKSNWGDSYYLEIFTSTNQQMLRVPDITGNPRDFQCLDYHSEAEQVEVLKKLANIVICYGLDKFNTIKPAKTYKITSEMEHKLFEDKQLLTQRFLEQNQFANLDDERVLQVLQQEIERLQEKESDEVQDKLVEIAAIYGELIIESMGGEWEYRNENTYIKNVPFHSRVVVLKDIMIVWKKISIFNLAQQYAYLLLRLYQYIDNCRRTYGPDWIPSKPYRGLLDMKKLDSRRPWAIHIVEKYGTGLEGDKTIRPY